MASDFKETMFKAECLDIFHYLRGRLGEKKVSLAKFGPMIGVDLKKTTLQGWLKGEERLRKMGPLMPDGFKRIVSAKNSKVEKVLATWMEKQRRKALPVTRKMLCDAAEVIYTVLQDCFESDGHDEGSTPSFSACWFTGFKRRFNISYCQLSGESGSVNMSAIEDELVEIRRICAEYSPDNIYNCDETGLYLKELSSKSYTVQGDKAGGKPIREARVSLLMCVNASGSSVRKAETMSALRPLLLAKHRAKNVDPKSLELMTVEITPSRWMNGAIFMKWLRELDSQLTEPSLLLLDSCPAHNKIDDVGWRYIRILRLPKNSTSVTQPLDAGCFSVFKRAYLEMLSRETCIAVNHDNVKKLFNGQAWSLLPYAWNRVKPSTIRRCFAHVPILPQWMRDHLRNRLPTQQEHRELEEYTIRNRHKEQEATEFEHLIAAVGVDQGWELTPIGDKDAQELADEELSLQPETYEEDEEDTTDDELLPPRRRRAPPDSPDDDLYSSPIGSDDYDLAFGLLSDYHGNVRLDSRAGVEETREAMSLGSPEELRLRAAAKEFMRAAASVATFRKEADRHNHATEEATEEVAEESAEGGPEGGPEGGFEGGFEGDEDYGLEDLFSIRKDSFNLSDYF